MKNRERMGWDSEKGRLRLANLAGDTVLREEILSKETIDGDTVRLIACHLRHIIKEMKVEWDSDSDSHELRRSLDLIDAYVRCLEMY
jgi:hypothetical protein